MWRTMTGAANQATISCNPSKIRRESIGYPSELEPRQAAWHAAAGNLAGRHLGGEPLRAAAWSLEQRLAFAPLANGRRLLGHYLLVLLIKLFSISSNNSLALGLVDL